MTRWNGSPPDPNWNATRRRILERDSHRCRIQIPAVCIGQATEVDHRIPRYQGGATTDANLQAACAPCHRQKTNQEAAQARAEKYGPGGPQSRYRRPEPHPGILDPHDAQTHADRQAARARRRTR